MDAISPRHARLSRPRSLFRPAHPRETPGFRGGRAKSGERQTVCWREMDSNFQYASVVNLVVAPLSRPAPERVGAHFLPIRQSHTALAAQQFAERLSGNRVREYDRRAERQERLAVQLGEADAI